MRPTQEEVDLHCLTVAEALPKLDQFLHTAFQAGLYRVWVVHGKGTGILRQEVGRYLSSVILSSSPMAPLIATTVG